MTVTVPVRGIRLHPGRPAAGQSPPVTVPVRGIRLHHGLPHHLLLLRGRYCPREGYKVASASTSAMCPSAGSYCPREGYKVASTGGTAHERRQAVTVPVRGIRLHPRPCLVHRPVIGYCPREGYKVASTSPSTPSTPAFCYCPREGYKVASAKVHKCKPVTLVRMMQLRK